MRRSLTWLVALPVIFLGSQVAHGIAYWWTYPQASLRMAVLQHSGHSYEAYAPIVLGFLVGLELLVFAASVLDRVRGRGARPLPAWLFLLLPIVAYTLQEHVERLLVSGTFPWWTVEQPTFARGIALQAPLGLITYLIARLLLRAAETVAEIIRADDRSLLVPTDRAQKKDRPAPVCLPRIRPLAFAAAGRAPPRLFPLR
jgi:hypothetical protein